MTGLQWFAFVILPALIVVASGLALVLFEMRHPRKR